MKRPHKSTPKPGKTGRGSPGATRRRIWRLSEAESAPQAPSGLGGEAGAGYRLLGQMLGGVLGGIGLGWLVDHFARTSPWGVVCGLLIGAVLSIYSTVRTASRMGERAGSGTGPADPAPDDDDD